MNKSIVLVMCDILVLSAMSLSSGGFSEADELDVAKMRTIDFDVVSRNAFEDLQQKLDEAQKTEADAKSAEKAAREAEALAKIQAEEASAQAETARQNEVAANAKAIEAEKREDEAKAAEKVAREAEELAKSQAKEAAAQAENARKNEAVAKAKAAEAQKREENAKVAEKAAWEAEALAKDQAKEAAAQEARAKADAETARANEALARADAEMARKKEMVANELAQEAQQREEQAKAELAKIRVRQNALVGDIPRKISWEMTIHTKKRNKKPKTRFSPLIASPSGCFLFVELPKIGDVKSYADVVSIVATHDTLSVTGELFRVEGHDDWLFVKIRDSFDIPHIGFGVESIGLDDNIVFYPDEQGRCSGNAVPCTIDNDGNFTCSVKTETRTIGQRIVGEGHSVYDGCFLLSTTRGSLGAIVRGDNPLVAKRKCEVISPLLETDLVRIQ